jgi:hypothetical protein
MDPFFANRNFGYIEIDWAASPVTLKVQARDVVDGHVVIEEKINLPDLSFKSNGAETNADLLLKIQQCEANVPKYYILPVFGIYAIVLKGVAGFVIVTLLIGAVRSLLKARKEGARKNTSVKPKKE